jgi:hypothetical protein
LKRTPMELALVQELARGEAYMHAIEVSVGVKVE